MFVFLMNALMDEYISNVHQCYSGLDECFLKCDVCCLNECVVFLMTIFVVFMSPLVVLLLVLLWHSRYMEFHKDQTAIVHTYPDMVQSELDNFDNAVCTFFSVDRVHPEVSSCL